MNLLSCRSEGLVEPLSSRAGDIFAAPSVYLWLTSLSIVTSCGMLDGTYKDGTDCT